MMFFKFQKNKKKVRKRADIIQIQIEQDSARSLYDVEMNRAYVDCNRAGCGLLEIVTKPCFENGLDSKLWRRSVLLAI